MLKNSLVGANKISREFVKRTAQVSQLRIASIILSCFAPSNDVTTVPRMIFK